MEWFAEGARRAYAEGYAKGYAKGVREVVEKMLAMGNDIAYVARITELDIETVLQMESGRNDCA